MTLESTVEQSEMSESTAKFPAIWMVHTVNGPVPCCEKHSDKLQGLMRFMGAHVGVNLITSDMECSNCVNESKAQAK